MKNFNLETIQLERGIHLSRENGLCLLEAVAWMAGERHSDRPECACPVVSSLAMSINDEAKEAERQTLKGLIPRIARSRSTSDVESRRFYMILDWCIRTNLPAWLVRVPELEKYATIVRKMGEVVSKETAAATCAVLQETRAAAQQASEWEGKSLKASQCEWALTRSGFYHGAAFQALPSGSAIYPGEYGVWFLAYQSAAYAMWPLRPRLRDRITSSLWGSSVSLLERILKVGIPA